MSLLYHNLELQQRHLPGNKRNKNLLQPKQNLRRHFEKGQPQAGLQQLFDHLCELEVGNSRHQKLYWTGVSTALQSDENFQIEKVFLIQTSKNFKLEIYLG